MSILACCLAVACSSGAADTLNGPDEAGDGPPAAVSSVEVTPPDVALTVDGTAELTVEVRTVDGEPLDRDADWTVRDASVAVVEGEGDQRRVRGLSPGITRVVATVDETADSARVEVNSSPSSPGGGQPAVVFDPDDYGSSAELRDDNTYGQSSALFLDQAVARPGGSSSMRYDYVNQGAGNAITIGKRVLLSRPVKEVWVEFQVRWSSNYMCCVQVDPNDGDPSTDIASHKFFFGATKATQSSPNWETSTGKKVWRWALLIPGPTGTPPSGPVNIETPALTSQADANNGWQIIRNFRHDVSQYFDEQWHTFRVHWSHDPGVYELWIDGQKIVDLAGFTVDPEIDLTALLLGRNKDDGNPSGTESLWWGKVEAWTQAPGW